MSIIRVRCVASFIRIVPVCSAIVYSKKMCSDFITRNALPNNLTSSLLFIYIMISLHEWLKLFICENVYSNKGVHVIIFL